MEKYTKSIKGQRGFSKMYQVLGECKPMRVPLSIYDKIKCIINLLEKVGRSEDLDKIHKILDHTIIGLEKIVKN
jgi:hypothetical protein